WKSLAHEILWRPDLPNILMELIEAAFSELAGGARMTVEQRIALVERGGACSELLMSVLASDDEMQIGPKRRWATCPATTRGPSDERREAGNGRD
ncbi:MAG: hypothetical protein NTX29_09205, partial [Actinobacteria bacterium]|nr:hypothetical protein [Actinomycetota bacterium]